MLERLLESRFKPERSVGGTIGWRGNSVASPGATFRADQVEKEVGGRKVRQLVQMPFVFKLSR